MIYCDTWHPYCYIYNDILSSSKYVKNMQSVCISDENRGADVHTKDAHVFKCYILFNSMRTDVVLCFYHCLLLSLFLN